MLGIENNFGKLRIFHREEIIFIRI